MLESEGIKSEHLVDYLERKRLILKKKRYQLLSSMVGIILYLMSYFVMICYIKQEWIKVPLTGSFSYSMVLSIMGQVQLLASIFLVLINRRIGYIVALILNIFALLSTFIFLIVSGTNRGLQGMIATICHLLVMTIIYIYVQFSEKKYKEVKSQKEEIMALYEENAASKVMLEEQKMQLERYNNMLREREKELNSLAYHDPLTGLPNRRKFLYHIETILHQNTDNIEPFAIVFIDLDNFKWINDSAGHEVGDDILQVISNRWKRIIESDDMIGRLGGDEFAIIFHHISEEYKIRTYIERLQRVMNEKVFLNHREFIIKASFGVSIYPRDGLTKEQLLNHADIAMYAAKTSQSNGIRFFNQSLKKKVQHTEEIDDCMPMMIEKRELSTVYQPQFYVQTGELRGFEVFARWKTRKMGELSPNEFIPVAEENGMMIEVGEWILRQACHDCRQWMSWYQRKLILAVNVSGVQLMDRHFMGKLKKVMDDTQFNLSCLEIDVNEIVFTKMPDVISVLKELQELGVSIAIDDFGKGSLSLNKLRNLPIDILKLDQKLIEEMNQEISQKAYIESVIAFAHRLNMMVTAEGVESQEEKEYLVKCGCDYVQGYYLGKPGGFEEACNLLEDEAQDAFLSEKKDYKSAAK